MALWGIRSVTSPVRRQAAEFTALHSAMSDMRGDQQADGRPGSGTRSHGTFWPGHVFSVNCQTCADKYIAPEVSPPPALHAQCQALPARHNSFTDLKESAAAQAEMTGALI
ncbi:hypothetical protein EYF80_000439 [Liparis tanakae]|uniref:Uncharacterized protein n=1 Tax=Liparis tanakae TaxID=230148 RepID=A0A4Z2JGQ7_9TELE|nr:hypothetical protein EYF80_000439 [Liparis tanakae]